MAEHWLRWKNDRTEQKILISKGQEARNLSKETKQYVFVDRHRERKKKKNKKRDFVVQLRDLPEIMRYLNVIKYVFLTY